MIKLCLSIGFPLLLLLAFGACKKYPEGPAFTLLTKKSRLVNVWKISKVYSISPFSSGKEITSSYRRLDLELKRDGSAKLHSLIEFFGPPGYEVETAGTWEFIDKKSTVSLDFPEDDNDAHLTILRLKRNELWLRNDKHSLEYHFVSGK